MVSHHHGKNAASLMRINAVELNPSLPAQRRRPIAVTAKERCLRATRQVAEEVGQPDRKLAKPRILLEELASGLVFART
jgi:hypothetical protein